MSTDSALLDSPIRALQDRGLLAHLDDKSMSLRSNSIDEKNRSFEAVVATETVAQVWDHRTYDLIDEILIARGGEFPVQAPLLQNHQRYSVLDVIGSAMEFKMDGNQWTGRGFIAEPATEDDEVRKIWVRVSGGFINAVSIGYRVKNFVDIPPGQTQTIGGKSYTANERMLRISTSWSVHEVSLTPIPADELALIRSRNGNGAKIETRRFFR